MFDSALINVGDVWVEDPINRFLHANDYERKILKLMGDYFGIKDVRGYVNSGSDESNF